MEFKKSFEDKNFGHINLLQKKIKKMISQQESIEESIASLEEELLTIENTCDEITFYMEQLCDHIESLQN